MNDVSTDPVVPELAQDLHGSYNEKRALPDRAVLPVVVVTLFFFALSIPELGVAMAGGQDADLYAEQRLEMVERQIAVRGVRQQEVLDALKSVPRHLFVPQAVRSQSYRDYPLAIGEGQTISQPYIVAVMTELLGLRGDEKVLEIGTGSGYQAAILCHLGVEVFSIEIIASLSQRAGRALDQVGCDGVHLRVGDGWAGWPEEAPFDAILLTAAPPELPPPLLEQLAIGGRLVAPVGDFYQELVLVTRDREGYDRAPVESVRFVPMTGEAQKRRKP